MLGVGSRALHINVRVPGYQVLQGAASQSVLVYIVGRRRNGRIPACTKPERAPRYVVAQISSVLILYNFCLPVVPSFFLWLFFWVFSPVCVF